MSQFIGDYMNDFWQAWISLNPHNLVAHKLFSNNFPSYSYLKLFMGMKEEEKENQVHFSI